MLAPRNKLWSTPAEVIDSAIEALQITKEDIVYDIGCGDGRFLIRCAEITGAKCIGVEINSLTAESASSAILRKGLNHLCQVLIENALELDYKDATVIFLYLIPRGLRLVLPKLLLIPNRVRIASYMAPLPPDMPPLYSKNIAVCVGQHFVEYPIYIYETTGNSSAHL